MRLCAPVMRLCAPVMRLCAPVMRLFTQDLRNLKRNTAVCVEDVGDGEKFIVFTRTHCGDSSYNCLWLKRRSANILEFMLGLYPNTTLDSSLCDVGKFGDQTTWNTVASK
ncbi:hypothetical protein FHG87_024084 [Trinorchestia longiramus]|nr:hypothetical protein FHG87_024084 [Trinorchestia longiramus]